MLACQGQRPGATACPPTIGEASGLAPHSANREALVRRNEREAGISTVLSASVAQCTLLSFIIPGPKDGTLESRNVGYTSAGPMRS